MSASPISLLLPDRVVLDVRAADEVASIRAVAGALAGHPEVTDAAALANEVIERERLSSTALGSGVAFPHARTTLVKEIVVAVGRCVAGVPFAGNAEPVHFIFVIGTPPDRAAAYLALVGTLARVLRSDTLRQKLLAVATADDFVAALRAAA